MKRALLTLIAGLFLAGCSLPSPQKSDIDSSASFYVDSVKPEFTSSRSHSVFSIPVSRTLSVKVCLKKNKQSAAMLNHEIEVKGGPESQRVATGTDGCLVFKEEIAFNALAPAKRVLLERSLQALGTEKGARKIELVVNPWGSEVLSLKEAQVRPGSLIKESEAVSALMAADTPARSIVLDGIRITLQPMTVSGIQRRAALDLTGSLTYDSIDVNGTRVTSPLSRGQFRFQYTLFYQPDQESKVTRHVIMKSPPMIISELKQGMLAVSDQFDLPAGGLCRSGVVYLGVSIEPLQGPVGLRKLEGVFYYGSCETRGTAWGTAVSEFRNRYEQERNITVDQYLLEAQPPTETMTPARNADGSNSGRVHGTEQNAPHAIEIRPLQFTTMSYEQTGSSLRKRNLQVQACLRSGWDRSPMRMAELEVQLISGQKRNVTTNDEGCVLVDDQVSYQHFARECWIKDSIHFHHKPTGFKQSVEVMYNPWVVDWAFRDVRFLDEEAKKLRCAEGKAEIILSRYDFDKQDMSYRLDKFLNLEVVKRGPFKITLKMRRPSLLDHTGISEETLPPGLYAVRLAVVDQYLRDLSQAASGGKVFSVIEKILPVRANSQIQEEIELATKNIKAMGNSNQIIAEVMPLRENAEQILKRNPNTPLNDLIDHDSNVKPMSFRSPLLIANNMEGGNFTVIENAQGSWVEKLKNQLQKDEAALEARLQTESKPALYARQNKLTLMNISDVQSVKGFLKSLNNPLAFLNDQAGSETSITESDLIRIVNEGFSAQEKINLCAAWINDFWQRALPNKNHGILQGRPRNFALTAECHRLARANMRNVFDIETKYFVREPRLLGVTDGAIPFRDFTIGQSFSLNKGVSDSTTSSWSWDVGAGFRLPDVPGLKFFSSSTGVRYSISKSHAINDGQATSISYSGGVGVTIETLPLQIEIPEYEKCLVIKLNPNLFARTAKGPSLWAENLHPRLSAQEQDHFARSGYLLCEGRTRREPLTVTENYYVINQKLSQAHIVDNASERTRPFFVALRGDHDFVRFLSFLQNSQAIPAGYDAEFQRTQMLTDPTQAVFIRGVTTAPGVLTRTENSERQTN